jgi:hypothetical protein
MLGSFAIGMADAADGIAVDTVGLAGIVHVHVASRAIEGCSHLFKDYEINIDLAGFKS